MKSDIFVITETWEKENNIEFRYKHLLNNYNLWSTITFPQGQNRKRKGVSIILSERARRHYHTTSILKDINNNEVGCLIKIELKFRKVSLIVIGYYIPPSREDQTDKTLVYNKSLEYLRDAIANDKHIIFMGDLNEWIMEDNAPHSILGNYLRSTSYLYDTWEYCNGKPGGETYPITNPQHKINYIYMSNNLIDRTIQCSKSEIQSDVSEDHCSLWTVIDIQFNTDNQHLASNQNKSRLDIMKASKEDYEKFKINLDNKINNYLENKNIEYLIDIDNIIYNTALEFLPKQLNVKKEEKINKVILKLKIIRKNLSHAISDLPKSQNKIKKIIDALNKWDSTIVPTQILDKIREINNKLDKTIFI